MPESSALYKFLYFRYYDITFSKRDRRRRAEKLTINLPVTNACNLNCKGCATYSPLVKDAQVVDIVAFKKDISRLSELLDGDIGEFCFNGGEMLLHPDLVEIISLTRQAFPKGYLTTITNGILLHKAGEAFWKCCHDNAVQVRITPYPIKLNYERIMALATEYQVEVIHYNAGDAWYKSKNYFRKLAINPAGNCDINKSFRRCAYTNCQAMRDGKIYRCNAPCFVGAFNDHFGQKFEVSEKDYVDIRKVKSKKEIFDFLAGPVPFCRYCDTDKWEFGIPWGHSKKEISEWM